MAVPEVADQLGVHRRTVERALSRLRREEGGRLPLFLPAAVEV
ncbi:helix-turn-helix domain-containing protein [uncultured Pseudacidovorax sp.]|nr:helix-turn-helix domain-containing protein [uncultured Pseudacidovorax sp.]